MKILNKEYLSLNDFIQKEMMDFPDFIQPPLYATQQEKEFYDLLLEYEQQQPGYLKYIVHEGNMQRIAVLRRLLDKESVNASNNPQLFSIITRLSEGLGVKMPFVYTYVNQDVVEIAKVVGEENASIMFERNNAFTLGTKDYLYVFVSEEMMRDNKLDDNELLALIAHEVGHAIANHSLQNIICDPNVLKFFESVGGDLLRNKISKIKDMLNNNLAARLKEVTADRASLLACRNVDYVCSMFEKLPSELMNYDDFYSSHPNNKKRIAMINLFAESQLYADCIERIDCSSVDKTKYKYSEQELQNLIMAIV